MAWEERGRRWEEPVEVAWEEPVRVLGGACQPVRVFRLIGLHPKRKELQYINVSRKGSELAFTLWRKILMLSTWILAPSFVSAETFCDQSLQKKH